MMAIFPSLFPTIRWLQKKCTSRSRWLWDGSIDFDTCFMSGWISFPSRFSSCTYTISREDGGNGIEDGGTAWRDLAVGWSCGGGWLNFGGIISITNLVKLKENFPIPPFLTSEHNETRGWIFFFWAGREAPNQIIIGCYYGQSLGWNSGRRYRIVKCGLYILLEFPRTQNARICKPLIKQLWGLGRLRACMISMILAC